MYLFYRYDKRSIHGNNKKRTMKFKSLNGRIELPFEQRTIINYRRTYTMNTTQNERVNQVTEGTIVIGIDVASELYYARSFDWRSIELSKVRYFEN